MQSGNSQLKWFAARTIRERSYVHKYLDVNGIRHSGIEDLKSLLFIHCTEETINSIRFELFDRVLFYRNADKTAVEPVPDRVMNTFPIMAPFHDEPVIYLSVDDPHFFEGPLKRIKGDRRLIVRLSDRAAIATPYIPQELLEDVK